MKYTEKPIEIFAVCTSNLLLPRGTPMRILKLLKGLAERDDLNLRITSTDDVNPIPGAEHMNISGGFYDNFKSIRESLKQKQCDIVIGHTLGSLRYLFLLKFFTKGKLLLEMHGFIAEEAKLAGEISFFKYWLNSFIHKFIFCWSDAVTTCSPTATSIIKKYNKHTFTVFNGADINLFSPKVQPEYKFKNKPDNIVIGYAGNTRGYQGLDFLLENFSIISRDNPEFKLALLLSKSYDVEEKSNEIMNSYNNVIIVKGVPHEEVPGFLASCDILVVPRPQNEVNRISFASKLLEYLAMGKPVVASNTSDADKIITNKINGIIYTPDSSDEFLEALRLLQDEKIRIKLGENARDLICNNYSNTDTNEQFIDVIKKYRNIDYNS